MSTTAKFAVTFVIFQITYIIFNIFTISIGFSTRFYLSLISDSNTVHVDANTFEEFSFITLSLICISIFMIFVSLMSCSILINDKRRTVLLYLLSMLVVIGVEIYVEYNTFIITDQIKENSEQRLSVIFKNVSTTEYSNNTRWKDDAISIQLSLKCCGLNSSTYWTDYNKKYMEKYCCEQSNDTVIYRELCDHKNIWRDNCLTKTNNTARKTTTFLFINTLINIILKVIGIVCFLCTYEWNKL